MSDTADFYIPTPPPPAQTDVGPHPGGAGTKPTAPRDFRELAAGLAPVSLSGYLGQRLVGALGLMFDALAEGAQRATLVRSMLSPHFSSSALPLIGSERSLVRYSVETNRTYQRRLLDACVLEQLAALGVTSVQILTPATEDPTHLDDWSRRWLVVRLAGLTRAPLLGSGRTLGNGDTLGSNARPSDVVAVQRVVRQFKSAHVRVPLIRAVTVEPSTYAYWLG
jgi:hypothetical protein